MERASSKGLARTSWNGTREEPAEKVLLENDRLVAVKKNAILNVPAHRAGQYDAFHVPALFDQVLQRVPVRDASDALLDDRSIIEDFGDVVRGGADEFYAPLEGLMMRLGAHKGGQEGMMNINDLLREMPDEIR